MGLEIRIPDEPKKIKEQIFALEWQLKQEITEKDKEIYKESLKKLKEKLLEIE